MQAEERKRAAWGSINRERVIEAAERSVQGGHFKDMTIRGLAAELGVAPMSLYRHVRDKDDLLDAVVDRLLATRWRPQAEREDWVAWTAEAAERFRDFLVSQPAALYVYLRRPVTSHVAMKRMAEMLKALTEAGFDDASAKRAFGTVHTYTIGFAALEASRSGAERPDPSEAEALLASFTTPRQFEDGLRYLLEGIARERVGPAPS